MPQQAFGCEENEGFAQATAIFASTHLAPQQVEVLGRSRAVANLHIVFCAELEKALDTRAGMLRPLSLIAVRQEQPQADGLLPLGLSACDELVDDHLRPIGEVAKLGFPQHQCQGIGHAVAEFKPEHSGFGEEAVIDLELCLSWSEMLKRQILPAVNLVEQYAMALAECASPAVLPAQTDRRSFDDQGSKGQ